MRGELKRYALRAARRPITTQAKLASTVQVVDERGVAGHCYVTFAEPLLRKVGMALPYGISERNPAYLRVEFDPGRQLWRIGATYITGTATAILWHTKDRPTWLRCYTTRRKPSHE